MPFEPQHIRARNLVATDKKQNVYGTALSTSLTQRLRFDGGAFAQIGQEFYSDLDRVGKGHPWPTLHQVTSQSTQFGAGFDVTDWNIGWLLAFCMGADTISGAGPYTHLFKFLQSSNQMPVTSLYFEDTADIKRTFPDMAIADLTISGADHGILQAQASFVGSGRYVDGALGGGVPALAIPTMLLGSDTDILIGAQGGAVSIKERIIDWQVKLSVALIPHRGPGGGLYATMTKIDQQRATFQIRVAAKDTDDMDTLRANHTLREVQINTNSGAAAQLKIKFPGVYLNVVQLGANGVEEAWSISADDASVLKSGSNDPCEITVINGQATYLVGAAA